jgi:hypothetical protein
MNYSLEIDEAAIVILGSFNPALFHPFWFNAKGLIKPEEAEASKIEVTHPTLSVFSMDWCKVQVELERFIIQATNPFHFDQILDLVLGTFTLLESVPVKALGMNRMMHFKVESREKMDAFGDMIAPKEIWKNFMKDPGLSHLIMVDPRDKAKESTQITIQRSNRLELGIFIAINDHHDIDNNKIDDMLTILKNSWQISLSKGEEKAQLLLNKVK